MQYELTILRYESGPAGTFGVALYGTRWLCHTLEPANRSGGYGSAIRAGHYELTIEWSPKFKRYLPTINAPGRTGLRIHAGNFVRETSGCIIVGDSRGITYINNSSAALSALIDYIKAQHITHINIIDYETISS